MELSKSEKENVKQGNDNEAFEMEVGTFYCHLSLNTVKKKYHKIFTDDEILFY